MSGPGSDAKRRRVVAVQRWLLNPPMKLLVWCGLVPGHAIVETSGRRSGRRRRTVVGVHREGPLLWIVAEQGHRAGWVLNLLERPDIRVRHRLRWREATAEVLDGDDASRRLATWGRPVHARMVRASGTDLTTVQVRLSGREADDFTQAD